MLFSRLDFYTAPAGFPVARPLR